MYINIMVLEIECIAKIEINMLSLLHTVQSLYNDIYGVHRNGPCYKRIKL